MRPTALLFAILLLVAAFGCAGSHRQVATPKNVPNYHLVIQVPRANFAHLAPNYQFMVKSISQDDTPDSPFEVALAYCAPQDKVLVCMVTVHHPYVMLELQALWQGPWPNSSLPREELATYIQRWKTDATFRRAETKKRNPDALCGQIRVGVSLNQHQFRGNNPVAQRWFNVSPRTEGWCIYHLPKGALADIPSTPGVIDFNAFTP